MKILNLGSCNIDYVYNVEHIVTKGETIASQRLEVFPGGKGLNQSIALARAGATVYHAGAIGADGEMLRAVLSEAGVNLKYLKTVSQRTGNAIIQVDGNAENSIILFNGANECIEREYIDEVLSDFSCGDLLLLQNEVGNMPYAAERAYGNGISVILNPSPFNREIEKIDFNHISWLILNQTEAFRLSGENTPENFMLYIRHRYPKLKTVLTLGSNGSIYFDYQASFQCNSFKVEAVDTTGAGDTYCGYFFSEIINGNTPQGSMLTASAAAAISVTGKGAAISIPEASAVKDFLRRNTSDVFKK